MNPNPDQVLPAAGGSYIRNADGTLVAQHQADAPPVEQPVPEAGADPAPQTEQPARKAGKTQKEG